MNVVYLCPSKHWKVHTCTDEDKCVLCEIDRLKGEVKQEQERGDRFLEKFAYCQREIKKLTAERDELKRDVDTLWDSIADMEVE